MVSPRKRPGERKTGFGRSRRRHRVAIPLVSIKLEGQAPGPVPSPVRLDKSQVGNHHVLAVRFREPATRTD